jgi:hypothetical protein
LYLFSLSIANSAYRLLNGASVLFGTSLLPIRLTRTNGQLESPESQTNQIVRPGTKI